MAFQNRNVEIRGWLAEVSLAPRIDVSKVGKETGKKIVLELSLDLRAGDIFGPIKFSPELPFADATLVHRGGVPPLAVEKCKVFYIPCEKVTTPFARGL